MVRGVVTELAMKGAHWNGCVCRGGAQRTRSLLADITGYRSRMVQDLVSPVKEFINNNNYEHLIL